MAQGIGFDFKKSDFKTAGPPPKDFDALWNEVAPESEFDALWRDTQPEFSVAEQALNAGKALVRGAGETASAVLLKAPAAMGRAAFNAVATDEQRASRDRGLAQRESGKGVLESFDEAWERALPETEPALEGNLSTQVARGVGSSLAFGPFAAGGFAGIAAAGALSSGAAGYQEAKAHGASDDTALIGFFLNAAGGTSEAIPLARIFGRINRVTGGAVKNLLIESGEELLQESGQSALSNLVAGQLFDEERDVLQGVLENGKAGALSAAILSLLASGAGRSRTGTAASISSTPEGVTPQQDAGNGARDLSTEANPSSTAALSFAEQQAAGAEVVDLTGPAEPGRDLTGPQTAQGAPGSPLEDPDIASAFEAAKPKQAVPAVMPTEQGLFGQQPRPERQAPEQPKQKVVQGNLIDAQKGDLPGQTSLLDEEFQAEQEPTPRSYDELLADDEVRGYVKGLADQAGQAQAGGMLLRDDEGKVTGRSKWAPKSAWWSSRPLPDQFAEKRVKALIAKMLEGKKPLGSSERRMADFLLDEAERQSVLFKQEQAVEAAIPPEPVDLERAAIQGEPIPTRRAVRVKKIAELSAEIARSFDQLGRKAQHTPFSGPGLDPERVAAVAKIASLYVQKGYHNSAQFIEDVVVRLGEEMRPYAEAAWKIAQEAVNADVPPSPPMAVVQEPSGNEGFDVPEDTRFRYAVRAAVDDLDRLSTLERAAPKKAEGDTLEQTLAVSPGKRFAQEEILDRTTIKPLKTAMRFAKIEPFESTPEAPSASDFLYAVQAETTNAKLREKFPERYDEAASPSGMSDAEAKAIVAAADGSPKAKAYRRIQEINQRLNVKRLDMLESSGLISAETRAVWAETWGEDYVPLRTVDDPHETFVRGSSSFAIAGPESKARKGRKSKADSPLAMAIATTQDAITRAERNKVGRKFAEIVEKNPHPDYWRIETDANKIKDGEFRLSFKENGEQRYIVTRDKALNDGFKRIEGVDPGLLKALDPIMSFFHAVIIRYNPVFPLYNFQRDLFTTLPKLAITDTAGFAANVAKNDLPAMRGARRAISKEGAGGYWGDVYRRAREAGALIGWSETFDFQTRQQDFEKAVSAGAPARAARAFAEFIDTLNRAAELGPRLATFDEAIKRGATPTQAAAKARRVTVDFARHGFTIPVIRRLYLFAGASVQGGSEFAAAVSSNPKRAAAVLGVMVFAGYQFAYLSRRFADEDENDENNWDSLPIGDKARRAGVMVNGTMVGPMLGYGFNIPYFMGVQLEELLHGKKSEGEVFGELLGQTVNAFSPLQGDTLGQALTPTVLRPFQEIETNRDFAGRPIMPPENPYDRTPIPDSQRSFPSVNPTAQKAAIALNEATGGNELEPGLVDISPESFEHFLKAATGGLGTFGGRVFNLIDKTAAGEGIRAIDIPVIRPFAAQTPEHTTQKLYYERVAESDLARDKQKRGLELSESQAIALRLEPLARRTDREIAALRKQLRQAKDEAARQRLADAIETRQQKLNRAFSSAAKAGAAKE